MKYAENRHDPKAGYYSFTIIGDTRRLPKQSLATYLQTDPPLTSGRHLIKFQSCQR